MILICWMMSVIYDVESYFDGVCESVSGWCEFDLRHGIQTSTQRTQASAACCCAIACASSAPSTSIGRVQKTRAPLF